MSETFERLASALAGRYRLERELGAGGMATVYLAQELKHDRMVAVKVLKPELAVAIGAERFLAEIKTTANLQHPHILALHDSGEANGTVYYVMPYVEGESLRDRLDREKQLPVDDALRIAGEVADALEYAHERGVIHRDIKPENILLQRGHAVVADFGIALAASRTGGSRMTETGMSLGTPTYMSPEQAMGSREVDARTDVYSLGCVLYEMLIGEPPFVGPTAQSIVAKVVTELPKSMTAQRHTVPAHVNAAVQVALEKLAADRFASAGAFAEALRSPGTSTRIPDEASRADEHGGRRQTRLIVTGLLFAAAVTGAFLMGRRAGGEGEPEMTIQPRTYRAQTIFNARYAANAESFVFSGAVSGNTPALYLVSKAFPEPRQISDSATHLLAVSSKDELAVLVKTRYLHHRVFSGTLAQMPMGGGAAREIATDVHEADWSPDGTQLAIAREVGGKDRIEYPIGTVLYETAGYVSELRVAPDGQRVAFNEHPEKIDDRGFVAVVDLARTHTALTPQYSTITGLGWKRDGKGLVFSGAKDGSLSQLEEVALRGGVRPRRPGVGDATLVDVGRDGRELILRTDAFSRMWLKRGDAPARDISWLDRTFLPTLSADGSVLIFGDASNVAGGSYATMLQRTNGANAVRLGNGAPLAISPDGQWVLSNVPTDPVRLMLFPVGAGTARRLDHGEFAAITAGAFAPNGTDVIVCGNEKASAPKCYAGSVKGSAFRAFTSTTGRTFALSPDGSEVVLATADSGYLRIAVVDGSARAIPGVQLDEVVLRFSPDGRYLWVRNPNALPVQVQRVDVNTGARAPLIPPFAMPQPGLNAVRYLALADDPHTYAWVQRENTSYLFELTRVK
ncbi:hypothetical protein BH11GEM2_BH11GEM2_31440 [soil metagenome]